jgi:hypothetical protein
MQFTCSTSHWHKPKQLNICNTQFTNPEGGRDIDFDYLVQSKCWSELGLKGAAPGVSRASMLLDPGIIMVGCVS